MNNYEDVKQRFARCMVKGDFVGRIYEIFLANLLEYPARAITHWKISFLQATSLYAFSSQLVGH